MTSNFAIGNAATAPLAPAPNASPSDNFARLLNPTAANGGQLIAGGLGRQTSAKIVERWRTTMESEASKTGRATESGKPFDITAPRSGRNTNVSKKLNTAIGGETLKVPDVPEFSGSISDRTLTALNNALTPKRLDVFRGLDEARQAVVRTLLSAALEAMDRRQGEPGYINPRYMGDVLDAALTHAQQTRTAPDRPAKQGSPAAATPTTPRVEATSASPGTPTTPRVQPRQPASAIDKSGAGAEVERLTAQEQTLLREIDKGKQGADIVREQKWSVSEFRALSRSAMGKLGATDLQAAARKAAKAGGLPADVAQSKAPANGSEHAHERYAHERFIRLSANEDVKRARLAPDDIKILSAWTQSYFDRDATASRLGLTADSLMSRLSSSARKFGLLHGSKMMGMNDLKRFLLDATDPRGSLPFTPTAPRNGHDAAALQRLNKLFANKQVPRGVLTTYEFQRLAYWTHFNFNRNAAASQLGITPELLAITVSAASKKLGFGKGKDEQNAFRKFLLEATK
jgi:hypothetical protein